MRATLIITILLGLCAHGVLAQSEVGKPFVRYYLPKEYNGHAQNWAGVQDNRGILYFGNGNGLMEYDGVNWRINELPRKEMPLSLAYDSAHSRIYIGSDTDIGYWSVDDQGNGKFISLTPLVPDSIRSQMTDIWRTHVVGDAVYFFSIRFLFRYQNNQVDVWQPEHGTRFRECMVFKDQYFIQETDGNRTWIKTVNGQALTLIPEYAQLQDQVLGFQIPYKADTVILGRRNQSLIKFPLSATPQQDAQAFASANELISTYQATNVVKVDDRYALGTLGNGVLVLDHALNFETTINKKHNGFVSSDAYFIFKDRDGGVWTGGDNGLGRINLSATTSFWDDASGIQGTIYAVHRHPKSGKVYVASSTNLYYYEQNQWKTVPNLANIQCWSFLSFQNPDDATDQRLLVTASSGTIYEVDGADANLISITGGRVAFKLYQDKQNPYRIWAAYGDGFGSIRFEKGKWITEERIAVANGNNRSIAIDAHGDIWLGTFRKGVVRLMKNEDGTYRVKRYQEKEGLLSSKNTIIFELGDELIFGTDKGVCIYNSATDRFEPYFAFGEEYANGTYDVFSLQEGKDGEVWLSGLLTSTSPALRFKKNRDGTYVKDDAPFMLVPPQMVLGFYVEKNGNAWLGGGDGLYKYSPTKTTTKRQGKFYTLIREVRTTNDSLVFGGNYFQESDNERYLALQQPKELKPALSSDQNLLLFRFAAAYYEYTEETEYQYKLEGFDSQWSAWTKRTEKEYSNLFGGNFTFRVRAKNVHGVIGEEASYSFKLAWPWYARWWAISLYVIGLVGILWGCIRWYSNQLKRDNARLEGIVNMRTAEIVEKNEELSQQNEEINRQNTQLEGTYRNVKMLSELGQEITSHLSVEKIIDTVYASVNDLMDAAGFGIGIYNEDSNELDFPGFIEKGEKLPYHSEPLDQEGLGAWCFTHRKEILMGNVEEEYQHYFDKEFETVAGNLTRSLIYLPLLAKNKAIGIITVQSFKKHAFSKYHLNMMRNLAVYVAIALENAESFHKIAEQKEEIAEQRDQLEQEKEKSDQLLLNILPQSTAEELKATGSAKPQLYESVTILFTDLINFTQLAEKLPAEELVAELDKIFRKFDEIVTKYNLEKIKTIGDAYMCVGGIPATNTVHPMNTVKAGLEMQTFITQQAMTKSGIPCQLRVGIHTGRVVAGVVGKKKFAYDIWGDAVNLAARMESNGEAGKVNISGATYELVKEEFSCDYRGKVEVKHKGEVDMYFVNAIKADGKQ